MYTRILVPLDGSEVAESVLPYVATLAKGLSAGVHLLSVVISARPLPQSYQEQVLDNLRSLTQEYLSARVDLLQRQGLSVTWDIGEGLPDEIIVREAELEPNTLIAMSTHGRGGILRWTLGSTTDRVLRSATNPLLVIRSQEHRPETVQLTDLVLPLDGSALGEQILEHAVPLARALDLRVHVVQVTPSVTDYYRFASTGDMGAVPYEDFAREADDEAEAYLAQVAERLNARGVSRVELHLLHGDPASAVVDMAQDMPNNLVAMTTHGRSGLGRMVLGSVADRVARHSGDPVLVVRATETTD